MEVFLNNNKIGITLQSGDDFKKIIAKIKGKLYPYSYDPFTKIWVTEKINLLIFEELFQNEKINYSPEVEELRKKQKQYLTYLNEIKSTNYKEEINNLKIDLMEHQKQAINCLLAQTNFGLFDEQGLGKTLSMIGVLCVLFQKEKIENCIIICPNTLKYNWVEEINKHSNLEYSVLLGDKEERIKLLKEKPKLLLTNFESLISKTSKNKEKEKQTKKIQKCFKDLITEKTCIIIDEAHRIKSSNSKISRFIRSLSKKTNYKYLLTGTPIGNKPEDIFYLFLFLDNGGILGRDYRKFIQQYCYVGSWYFSMREFKDKNLNELLQKINYFDFYRENPLDKINEIVDDLCFFEKWKGMYPNLIPQMKFWLDKLDGFKENKELYGNSSEIKKINRYILETTYPECPKNPYLWTKFSEKTIVGYKNLDKLKFLVGLRSIRRRKEEVIDLPEKLFENRKIEISEKHRNFYNKLKEGILKKRTENGTMIDVEGCLIRLIQAASNPLLLDNNCKIENNKIKELDILLEEHIELSNNKVVLWTSYLGNFPFLLERYKKYNPVYINGEVKTEKRQEMKNKFQTDSDTKLIICNMAAKEGLTLVASCVAIYLDRDFTLFNYKQSIDRIHRIGQSKTCLIINLIHKNTIDEVISENLYIKDIMASYIQGDNNNLENYNLMSNREILEKSLQ